MYEFTIEVDGLEENINYINYLYEMLDSLDFMEFISEKALSALKTIMDYKLQSVTDEDMPMSKLEEYKKNNVATVTKDYIEIKNDTTLTQEEMYWVSDKTRERYPDGISIAYVVEYGTGLRGVEADDWAINLPSPSKNSDGSWSFARDGKKYLRVIGTSPKLVYLALEEEIEQRFEDWVLEYIESELD